MRTEEAVMMACKRLLGYMVDIYHLRFKEVSFEMVYRECWDLCIRKHGDRVEKVLRLALRMVSMMPRNRRVDAVARIKSTCTYWDKCWAQ